MGTQKGYCVNCNRVKEIANPMRVKIRNRKTRSGTIDAWRGHCQDCDMIVYRIIGH